MDNYSIDISICCITYNHVSFIERCLDGFIAQQGDLSIEILIHDDASTDGTQEIIKNYQKRYPNLIKPIFQKENQWSKGVHAINSQYNFSRAKGKYIALCEGDDFWTNPHKLNKQVEVLNKYKNCILVSGGYLKDDVPQLLGSSFFFKLKDFPYVWKTKTLTLVFRNGLLDYRQLQQYNNSRDIHLVYHLLRLGDAFYINEVLGQYNTHNAGIFSTLSQQEIDQLHYHIYKELYSINKEPISKKCYFNSLVDLGRTNKAYTVLALFHVSSFVDFKIAIINLFK
ncbi:glycosyltransferase [Soonwooa sp.]|uniref:glycosyltransferase family 2 protein n=1 Tax=Soonwooa sp. TaxID=1938592 RepID=UPI0028A9A0B7|nr:glycosyltransferase [Soonwooa sp.]